MSLKFNITKEQLSQRKLELKQQSVKRDEEFRQQAALRNKLQAQVILDAFLNALTKDWVVLSGNFVLIEKINKSDELSISGSSREYKGVTKLVIDKCIEQGFDVRIELLVNSERLVVYW